MCVYRTHTVGVCACMCVIEYVCICICVCRDNSALYELHAVLTYITSNLYNDTNCAIIADGLTNRLVPC